MPITPLPEPPSRADSTNFAQRGDAFMAALPGFAVEANALAADVSNKQGIASAAAAAAIAQADIATTKAGQAGAAATAAGNSAGSAAASEAAALAYKNAAENSASNAATSEANAAASAGSVDAQGFATDYAGPTEPPVKWPYMAWADTGNMRLKRRNAANTDWIDLGPLLKDLSKGQNIAFTPAGNLVATNVQAALEELDSEKQAALGFTPLNKAGDTMLGTLNLAAGTLWGGWNIAADAPPAAGIRFRAPGRYWFMGGSASTFYFNGNDGTGNNVANIFTVTGEVLNFRLRPTVAGTYPMAYAGIAGAHIGTITEYGAIGTGTVSTVVTSSPQVMIGLRGNGAGLFYPQGRAYQMV